jgi:hypothetical protein
MPEFEYPIFTFSVSESEAFRDTYETSSTTVHYTHLLKGLNSNAVIARQKRKVITGTLSLLKRALGNSDKRWAQPSSTISA